MLLKALKNILKKETFGGVFAVCTGSGAFAMRH